MFEYVQAGERSVRLNYLKAGASVGLVLLGTMGQQAQAQQAGQQPTQQQQTGAQTQTSPTQAAAPQAVQNDTTGAPGLPQAPKPTLTEPLFLRDTQKDYTHLRKFSFRDPFSWYKPTDVPEPRLSNTGQLSDLLRDGKLLSKPLRCGDTRARK